jgi:DNA-binding response OmpR family regulator
MKILIIDDEESIRDSFKWHLEGIGHEVTVSAEPLPCKSCSDRKANLGLCYDVLIVDYDLPLMTGLEYVEQMLQRNCMGAEAKKILISGRTGVIDYQAANRLGCMIEEKPLRLDRLEALVEG